MTSSTETALPSTLLRTVTPQDLFNLPLYEHHLVIDTRAHEEYADGHIATAVSLPSPCVDCSEAEREKLLVQFIKSYVKEYVRPENPSPVVLYGSNQPECVQHIEWLAIKLERLQTDRKALAKVTLHGDEYMDMDEVLDPFECFCHTIADRVREIWVLDCGYKEFCTKYNFLCGLVTFESMFPLPHQINRNIFLGSRAIPLTRECLSTLKITHMIVSSHQTLDWSELEDISILHCDVEDSNKQGMIPCWNACLTFIEDALSFNKREVAGKKAVVHDLNKREVFGEDGWPFESHVRILVILHGRSRSASVVLAYLIRTMRMGFDEAWQFVRKNCWHLIDSSLIYEDQLKEWEKRETRALDQN